MAVLMDCALEADKILSGIRVNEETIAAHGGIPPTLGIVTSGTDPASAVYVRNKKKDCEAHGLGCVITDLHGSTKPIDYIEAITSMAHNPNIHGIILQLPVPLKKADLVGVTQMIPPYKDVDGLTPSNIGDARYGYGLFRPCTPSGIIGLLKSYRIPVMGKHAVVLGRSEIVGKPMAEMLLEMNATVTICHSKTEDLEKYTKDADILISAVGKPKFLTGDMIKPRAVVVDVGINRDENNKLCGDVDYDSVAPVASYITKVPGGVGLLTRAKLLEAVYIAWMRA